MGVAYNPRVVTDRLVTCYDLGNTRRSYSPNVHPSGTNIYDWYVGIKGNNTATGSTISKDTTTSSPVGNTPLKMVVTGTDPYLQMYNNSVWNLSPALIGETWVVSVYVKASVNTTVQLFMFGANSSGGVFSPTDYSSSTINVTTEWTRIQHVRTFQNAATNYIHIRLDGPDTQGGGDALGQEIWWDGLQVERGSTPSNFTSDYTSGNVLDISKNSNNGTIVSSLQYNNSNGGYVTFDGSNDYIGIGVTAGELGIYDDSYTFEAWVYPTDISALSGDNFIFGTPTSSLREGLHLGFRNTNIYQGHYSADYVSGTVTANQWYHLAWTYEKNLGATNGTAKIYKNGQLQGNYGIISSFIGSTEIQIGKAFFSNSPHFQGRGAQFKVYNKALTASEVKQNFDTQKVRYGTFDPEPTIVRDSLALYYDASNNNSYTGYGTLLNDIASSENPGTLVGPTYNTDGYFLFDGVDDYISITDNLGNPQQFTVECWVYPSELDTDSGGVNEYRRILTHSGASSNNAHSVLIEQNGEISFRIPGGSTDNFRASGFTDVNQWGHIVCTYDQTDRKIYFNGTLRGTRNEPDVTVDFGSPAIVSPNNNQTFKGRIANFRIYSKALSLAEVQQNYDASKVRFIDRPSVVKDGLQVYLDAGNTNSYSGTGTTWTDLSGNGNDATLEGGVAYDSSIGGFLTFDGTDDYVDLGRTYTMSRSGGTCSFWINKGATARSSLLTYQANSFISHVEVNTNNFITETKNNCNTFNSPNFIFNSNEWYYFTFKFELNRSYWYINGEYIGESSSYGSDNCSAVTATELLDNFDFRYIGQSVAYSGNYDGRLASFKFYNRALSNTEIKQNFYALKERFGI